jgi:hypothetical protein
MTNWTKDDIISRLKMDKKILELENHNKQLVMDNDMLRLKTLEKDINIHREKDRQALEKMGDKMDNDSNIEYIHYLEHKEQLLLNIINDFIREIQR